MAASAEQKAAATAKIKLWLKDSKRFVRECINAEPDDWQDDVLTAYDVDYRLPGKERFQRIALKASKGPGKTTLLAWIILHFLATRPHPKIACTSISGENLSDDLWTELSKWIKQSPFLNRMFEWTKTKIYSKEHPETWWASARQWSRSADREKMGLTLAGLHADFILMILDEAGGIPDAVAVTADAALSSGIEARIIIAGNPTHLEGPLWRACNEEADIWWVKEINGDPDNPKRAPRIKIEWARQLIRKHGRDNPWVLVNVFGEFPPESPNALLGPDDVRKAMERHIPEDSYSFASKRLGVDVARFGDDESTIFPRQGLAAFKPVVMRNLRSTEVAARVVKAKLDWSCDDVFVDASGGWGAGVADCMVMTGHPAVEVQFGGKADDPTFYDKRTEMWYRMAQWVKKGGALPEDGTLKKELVTAEYHFHKGKLKLEEKDHMKERLGYSPDRADGLACTFFIPDTPAMTQDEAILEMALGQGKAKIDPDTIDKTEYRRRGRTYLDRPDSAGKAVIDPPSEED